MIRKKTVNYYAKRRSHKKVILILGLAVVGIIFLYPVYQTSMQARKFDLVKNNLNKGSAPEITKIESPKFYGRDEKEQTYTITAKGGVEKKSGFMVLEDVWADFKMQDNTYMELRSDKADIYHNDDYMNLNGNVNIVMNNGYVMSTDSAKVLYKDKSISGAEPVEVVGVDGRINAPAFHVVSGMQEIVFDGGRVHTIFYDVKADEKK